MAYELSKLYGSHPHMQPQIFHCPVRYAQNLNKLKGEYDRSSETFTYHFKNNYHEKLPNLSPRLTAEEWMIDYNHHRPHESLGDLSPVQFLERHNQKRKLSA